MQLHCWGLSICELPGQRIFSTAFESWEEVLNHKKGLAETPKERFLDRFFLMFKPRSSAENRYKWVSKTAVCCTQRVCALCSCMFAEAWAGYLLATFVYISHVLFNSSTFSFIVYVICTVSFMNKPVYIWLIAVPNITFTHKTQVILSLLHPGSTSLDFCSHQCSQ